MTNQWQYEVRQFWSIIHTPELPVGSAWGWTSAEPTSLPFFFLCPILFSSPLYRFYLRTLIQQITCSGIPDSGSAFRGHNLRQLARLSEERCSFPHGLHQKQGLSYLLSGPQSPHRSGDLLRFLAVLIFCDLTRTNAALSPFLCRKSSLAYTLALWVISMPSTLPVLIYIILTNYYGCLHHSPQSKGKHLFLPRIQNIICKLSEIHPSRIDLIWASRKHSLQL